MHNINNNTNLNYGKRNDYLKLLAIMTMLIDHVGYLFFPKHVFFRVIGRVSFPIFAYLISRGYKYTSNLERYLHRLLLLGIFSQLPYILVFKSGANIFFTLVLGLMSIYCFDKINFVGLFICIVLSYILPVSYGIYGVFTILAFHVFQESRVYTSITFSILTFIYFLHYNAYIQFFSIFSLFFIFKEWKSSIQINKHFSYFVYPIHLFILVIFSYILS